MIKRINRTQRKTIIKRDVEIRVRPTEGRGEAPIFDVQMDLSPYGFPDDARVRIEVARSNASQRWDFGTVGEIMEPREQERRLTDVPNGGTFRVFVVADDGTGRLLGHAPRLQPKLPRNSRLPLEERDLGEEVWRVEFDGEEGVPVLLVNSKVEGISEIVRSDPSFRALVMPEVFRAILTRMTLINRADPEDENGPWTHWFGIARAYHPDEEPPALPQTGPVDTTEIDRAREWIDAVVARLAERPLDAANAYTEARR